MKALVIALSILIAAACGDGATSPSDTAVVTVQVGNETFRMMVVGEQQIAAARAVRDGGQARIPFGRIVSGSQVNEGWSWHLEDVEFARLPSSSATVARLTLNATGRSSAAASSAPGARRC